MSSVMERYLTGESRRLRARPCARLCARGTPVWRSSRGQRVCIGAPCGRIAPQGANARRRKPHQFAFQTTSDDVSGSKTRDTKRRVHWRADAAVGAPWGPRAL